jgi:hypothetical protein
MTAPAVDFTNPAELAAHYGPFGFSDHWRKVVLANCREIIRAESAVNGEKCSEARTDDLARLHPLYLEWLTTNLQGRIAYEAMVKEAVGV